MNNTIREIEEKLVNLSHNKNAELAKEIANDIKNEIEIAFQNRWIDRPTEQILSKWVERIA